MHFVSVKERFPLYYIASFRYTNLFIRKSDISTFIFCILYIKINYLQRDVIDICSNDGDKVPYKFFYIPRKKLMWFHNLIIKHLLVFILCFGRRPNSGDRSAEDAMTSLIKKCTWPVQCWNLLSVTSMHTNCEGLKHNWWLLWQTFKTESIPFHLAYYRISFPPKRIMLCTWDLLAGCNGLGHEQAQVESDSQCFVTSKWRKY